jgi:hypothetical protein
MQNFFFRNEWKRAVRLAALNFFSEAPSQTYLSPQ